MSQSVNTVEYNEDELFRFVEEEDMKDEDVEDEDDNDDLRKDDHHAVGLAREGHIEKDAEDIQRKQRDDGNVDGLDDDFAKIAEETFQRWQAAVGDGQTKHEGKDECRHHIEHGRNVEREVGLQVGARWWGRAALRGRDHRREEP